MCLSDPPQERAEGVLPPGWLTANDWTLGTLKLQEVPISLGESFLDWCYHLRFHLHHLLRLSLSLRRCQVWKLSPALPCLLKHTLCSLSTNGSPERCLLHRGPELGQIDLEVSEGKAGAEPLRVVDLCGTGMPFGGHGTLLLGSDKASSRSDLDCWACCSLSV